MVQVGVCSFVNLVNICLRHVAAFLAIYTFNHCFLLHWFPHTQQINLSDLSFFSLSWEYSRDVAVVVSLPLVTGVQIWLPLTQRIASWLKLKLAQAKKLELGWLRLAKRQSQIRSWIGSGSNLFWISDLCSAWAWKKWIFMSSARLGLGGSENFKLDPI